MIRNLPAPLVWPVLVPLNLAGWAIGSIAWDLYMSARWQWKYRGSKGRAIWREEVRQAAKRLGG